MIRQQVHVLVANPESGTARRLLDAARRLDLPVSCVTSSSQGLLVPPLVALEAGLLRGLPVAAVVTPPEPPKPRRTRKTTMMEPVEIPE